MNIKDVKAGNYYYAELIETPEVIIPEYVECLENSYGYTIKNRIYKVIKWKKSNVWVICNLKCGTQYSNTHTFFLKRKMIFGYVL